MPDSDDANRPSSPTGERASGWLHQWWLTPRKVLALTALAWLACIVAAFTATGWNAQFDLRIYYDAMTQWRATGDLYAYAQPDPIMGNLGFTYPPIAAFLMRPMLLLPFAAIRIVTLAAIGLALAYWVWLLLRDASGLRGKALVAVCCVGVPLALMVEPIRENLSYGQINVFLALLVVVDLLVLGRRGSRWFGVGIGVATALKLTPGIFVIYLIVTRRWRAVGVAVAGGLVATGIAAIFDWADTWHYFSSLLWDSTRVGRPESVLNQSINGLLARFAAPGDPSRAVWAVAVIVVLVVGMQRARRLWLDGDEVAASSVVGLVGLGVSPISWLHHAVWVLPALLVLGHRWWEMRSESRSGAGSRRGRIWAGGWWVVGALAFGMQPTSYIHTEIDDWGSAGWPTILLSGLPTLWMVVTVAVLPARRLAGSREWPAVRPRLAGS